MACGCSGGGAYDLMGTSSTAISASQNCVFRAGTSACQDHDPDHRYSESQREELSGRYAVVPRDKVAVVQNGFYFPWFSPEQREAARRTFGYGPEDFVRSGRAAWLR